MFDLRTQVRQLVLDGRLRRLEVLAVGQFRLNLLDPVGYPVALVFQSLEFDLEPVGLLVEGDDLAVVLLGEVIKGERGLQDSLEAMINESVYRSDYREAAMVVAQRNPELLAEILRQ